LVEKRPSEELVLLRAALDGMLDPQILFEPVRDRSGRITDFVFQDVNTAVCLQLGVSREGLVGQSLVETFPNVEECGMLARYERCAETGEPIVLDEFPFFNTALDTPMFCDIRGARTAGGFLTVSYRDVTERVRSRKSRERSHEVLRAAADAMPDPHVLVEASRNPAGEVVDFSYLSANRAACRDLQAAEGELVDHSVLERLPNLDTWGLLSRYKQCLADGEPIVLSDFPFSIDLQDGARRWDIRATPVGPDILALSWCDVTERFAATQRLAQSEQRYRLLAENVSDAIAHVRDGRFVWASPAIEIVLGAPPEYWIGRDIGELVPFGDTAHFQDRMAILEAGGTLQQRIRMRAADGRTHYVHVHATPFFDAEGHRDGFISVLRLVDDEVAAERLIAEARRQQARADALFRRSVENSAVGMCLINSVGDFVEVNEAMCDFFGYDAETLKQKSWHELTAPAFLDADLRRAIDVVTGRTESYRMLKQYIHADGHLIWGDLSVSCVRDKDGRVEQFISQIIDVTHSVEASERIAALNQRLGEDLRSAAAYMASIMPRGLTGPVNVSSRYLQRLLALPTVPGAGRRLFRLCLDR
jgi:PAS domain S-box-containing protein